jgi:hypothetical protein
MIRGHARGQKYRAVALCLVGATCQGDSFAKTLAVLAKRSQSFAGLSRMRNVSAPVILSVASQTAN